MKSINVIFIFIFEILGSKSITQLSFLGPVSNLIINKQQ